MLILVALVALTADVSLIPSGQEDVRLTGSIGSGVSVRMTLWRNASRVGGDYVDEETFIPIWVEGSMRGDTIELAEAGPTRRGARFSGRVSSSSVEGFWSSADGRRKLPFRLVRDRDPTRPAKSWRLFNAAGWPVEFQYPRRLRPNTADDQVSIPVPLGSDEPAAEQIVVRWGRGLPNGRYSFEGRWLVRFGFDTQRDGPASMPFRVSGLEVRRDEPTCRIRPKQGPPDAVATCESALVLGPGFWVTLEGPPQTGRLLDVMVRTMRPFAP